MQWFCHCVRLQIDSMGVFVWALAPFLGFGLSLAVCFAVSAGETQVWLGDLRVVVFGVVVFCLLFIDLHILRTFLSLYSVLTAYSHVRTEPQCDIGQTRGKKKVVMMMAVTMCFDDVDKYYWEDSERIAFRLVELSSLRFLLISALLYSMSAWEFVWLLEFVQASRSFSWFVVVCVGLCLVWLLFPVGKIRISDRGMCTSSPRSLWLFVWFATWVSRTVFTEA